MVKKRHNKSLKLLIVASEASDLIFKIIIFHDVPQGPQVYTQCFPELFGEGGVEFVSSELLQEG